MQKGRFQSLELDESVPPSDEAVCWKLLQAVPGPELVALCRALAVDYRALSSRVALLNEVLGNLAYAGSPLHHACFLMPSWLAVARELLWNGKRLPESLFFFPDQPHTIVSKIGGV